LTSWQKAPPTGDISLAIGDTTIVLPPGHALPEYLKNFQNYDRFLPALVREMPRGSWIIDVGANCGDSLAAMVDANPRLNFLCLEADANFFGYLEKNIVNIRDSYPMMGRVLPLRALVGTAETSGVLIGGKGTKHLMRTDGGETATPLWVVADNYLPPRAVVSLIKVDVDGLDFDVLQSAATLLVEHKPLLYFECFFSNDLQRAGYLALFTDLITKGYSTFWLFDNFGAPVIATASLDVISSLFDYVWLQNQNHATRTIYYYDVLACAPHSAAIAHKVLGEFHPR
jgi:FkbM family methyltransferase